MTGRTEDLQEGPWDRVVRAVQHPVRGVAWAIALGALVGPIGGVSWVVVTCLGAWVGLIAGEVAGRSRVRLPWLVFAGGGVFLAALVCSGFGTRWAVLPSIVGPSGAVWLTWLAIVGVGAAVSTGLLRIAGVRGPAWQVVELGVLGALLANAVASHRDGSIARPLWLSDWAWSFGVDPGRVLLVFGAVLTALLATLLLLGAQRRKPGLAWVAVPGFALLAFFLAMQLPVLEPPDPEELFAEAGDASGEGSGSESDGDAGGGAGSDGPDGGGAKPEDGDGQGGGSGSDGGAQGGGSSSGEGDDGQGGGSSSGEGDDGRGGASSGEGDAQGGGASGDGDAQGGGAASEDGDPTGGASEGDGDPSEGGASEDPPDEPPDPLEGAGSGKGDPPVAVVLIDDDYSPPSGYWYLRQGVLDDFNGTRLVESGVPGATDDILDHFPTDPLQPEVLPFQPPTTFRRTVHGSVSLLVEHPNPFAPEAPTRFAVRANPNPARFDRSYAFVSEMVAVSDLSAFVGMGVGNPGWSKELRDQYLETPADPRYADLALQIRSDLWADLEAQVRERALGPDADPSEPLPPDLLQKLETLKTDPYVQATAVTVWLSENMKYTKSVRHAEAEDPTAHFLFTDDETRLVGYCVHSAHASVYLWRELGIPARVATGYAVEEAERRGSTLLVRSGMAHAWSELYITGVGWVPMDVSPAENLDPTGDPPDEDEAAMLGEMARHQPDAPSGPRPDYSWVWTWLGYTTGGVIATVLSGVLLLHWVVKLWRRIRPLWAGAGAMPRVAYRCALDQLADAGLVRQPGETREAFARRVGMPALQTLTAMHLRGALGAPGARVEEGRSRAVWTGLLLRLRVEIARDRPRWRRWMGMLDPSTVYRIR
jgi:transglutaminase-like putative cysteine protease